MRPKNPPRKCDFCDRTFSRTEHLVRHRRTHTHEKPFSCSICHSSFPRADVQQRHMQRIHPEHNNSEDWNESTAAATAKRSRSKVACEACRRRKLKCTGESPCYHCQASRSTCTFSRSNATASAASRHDHQARTSDRSTPQGSTCHTQTAIDDANDPDTAIGSTTNAPTLASGISQNGYSGNIRSWNQGLEALVPELDQLNTLSDWENGHEDLGLVEGGPFQGAGYGAANIESIDGFWHLENFDTGFWPEGMDFSFADGFYVGASSAGSVPGSCGEETRPEIQLAPVGHLSTQNAIDMMQQYFDQVSRPSSPRHGNPKNRWFSTPPRFQIYDEEVMDIFAAIARHHLMKTFPILDDFVTAEDPRKTLRLAYAAVGGLFCSISGRFKVTSSIYNDARRMLLDPTYQEDLSNLDNKFSAVKTFILLEIYGLYSGDKRSFEFVEAFHLKMLTVLKEYKQAFEMQETTLGEHRNNSRALTESLFILESYRVILLLRPPNTSFQSDFALRRHDEAISSPSDRGTLLTALLTPGSFVPTSYSQRDRMIALTSISIMSWPVLPRGTTQPQKRTLWNAGFIELALNSWAQTQSDGVSWSMLLLYHLIHVSIHTNMGLVQRFAHSPADSSFRTKSGRAFACIEQWQRSSHYQVAKWHAQSILRHVKDAMTASQMRPSDSQDEIPAGTRLPLIWAEAPHLPYCVYFSGLILWCGSIASADGKELNLASLENCRQLLSGMKVRVAELLEGILRELQT